MDRDLQILFAEHIVPALARVEPLPAVRAPRAATVYGETLNIGDFRQCCHGPVHLAVVQRFARMGVGYTEESPSRVEERCSDRGDGPGAVHLGLNLYLQPYLE